MHKLTLKIIYIVGFLTLTLGAYSFLSSSTQLNELSELADNKEKPVLFVPPNTPSELVIFREKMPLEYPDVYESFDREIFTNCYYHSSSIRILKLIPRYQPIIMPILEEEGVPGDFFYLAVAESALDPSAVSASGAVGLWQFMKQTAIEFGLEVNDDIDERYHAEKATRAACRYLKASYERFGSWTLVAAAYNAGNAGIERQITRQNQKNYYDLLLNSETARYVFRIAALKTILESPVNYGFSIPEDVQYKAWKTREIQVSGSIADLASWSEEQGTNYKILKTLNPWLRQINLANKLGKTYIIKLPLKGERI
ncbi:MAG: lytic transglycosylase domain-containing protein [Mangrovibacterium sp.]